MDEPDQAVRQLIDLANRGGGPDNITCVVADVIDLDRQPPTGGPGQAVGAAANTSPPEPPGGGPAANTTVADTPAGRAAQLRDTMPQQPVAVDEMPPPAAPAGDPMGGPPMAQQAPMAAPRRGPRRWTWLVIVAGVAVIGVVAGGFVLLQNARNGYYIGQAGGQAKLYRGTPQKVLGLDLSREAKQKNLQPIAVADLPQDLQRQVKDTYTVDGPGDWKTLVDRVCKYSLVNQSGRVTVVRGRDQQNCRETKIATSELGITELPASDASKIGQGENSNLIGRPAADTRLQELTVRRDQCKRHNSGVPDCPSSGGGKP